MILVAIAMKFEMKRILLLSSNSLYNFKQIERKAPKILHFHFSLSCRIAAVRSYLSENEAKNLLGMHTEVFAFSTPFHLSHSVLFN